MNILLINYEYPPIGAGAANATYNIAKCLVKKGHNTTVLTSCFNSLRGMREEEGITVHRCLAIRKRADQSNIFEMLTFNLSAFFKLPVLIRKHKIDASIVFFSIPCGPLGLWGKISSGVPYVVSLRGGDVPGNEAALNQFHRILKPVRRMVFKNSLSIVANSKGLKQLSELSDPYHAEFIPNGVDTSFFYPDVLKKNNNIILYVGRFQFQKNLKFLLEQIDIVSRETDLNFELHMVGGGPIEKELQDFSKNLNCHEKIMFHSWLNKEQLREFYQKASCLLNLSFCEGMPNTVLEAMACGCPVIASDVPGNNELVTHGKTGFLFNLRSPEKFREYLINILQNKDMIVSMGNKSSDKVKKELSWGKVTDNYVNLLNSGQNSNL